MYFDRDVYIFVYICDFQQSNNFQGLILNVFTSDMATLKRSGCHKQGVYSFTLLRHFISTFGTFINISLLNK